MVGPTREYVWTKASCPPGDTDVDAVLGLGGRGKKLR